ncbi:MAG TPA: IS200/IS605 family transposase [Chloroflexota bacterium]|nr:IS200/IS605 family transposase [Chloroflexota bacterium]
MTNYAQPSHRAYLEQSLGAHAAYKLHYHIVWSVKARHRILVGEVATALHEVLVRCASSLNLTLLAFHVEPEHVHLLTSLRPDMAVATVTGRLKGATSRQLRQQFSAIRDLDERSLWNDGYFARTLGDINIAQAKAYLDRQQQHHDEGCDERRPEGRG